MEREIIDSVYRRSGIEHLLIDPILLWQNIPEKCDGMTVMNIISRNEACKGLLHIISGDMYPYKATRQGSSTISLASVLDTISG